MFVRQTTLHLMLHEINSSLDEFHSDCVITMIISKNRILLTLWCGDIIHRELEFISIFRNYNTSRLLYQIKGFLCQYDVTRIDDVLRLYFESLSVKNPQ